MNNFLFIKVFTITLFLLFISKAQANPITIFSLNADMDMNTATQLLHKDFCAISEEFIG